MRIFIYIKAYLILLKHGIQHTITLSFDDRALMFHYCVTQSLMVKLTLGYTWPVRRNMPHRAGNTVPVGGPDKVPRIPHGVEGNSLAHLRASAASWP